MNTEVDATRPPADCPDGRLGQRFSLCLSLNRHQQPILPPQLPWVKNTEQLVESALIN